MKKLLVLTILTLLAPSVFAQVPRLIKKTTGIAPADLYRAQTASEVERNWKYDRSLIREQKPVAAISFKVLPDGRVTDFEFKQQSWNKHFDAGVLNAVIRSIPFKPFPPEITDPWIEVQVRFIPN